MPSQAHRQLPAAVTVDGVSFSFELTAGGWFSNPSDSGGYIQVGADNETTPAWMIFWNPDNVYADPCAHMLLDPAVGPSAGALAAALLTIPGTDATGPTIVTVNRSPDDPERRLFDATYVELTVHEDVGCAAEDFYLWRRRV